MEEEGKGKNKGETAQSSKALTRWVRLRVAGASDSTCYHPFLLHKWPPVLLTLHPSFLLTTWTTAPVLQVPGLNELTECYELFGFGTMVSGPTPPVQFPVPDTQGIFPFPDTPLGCSTHTLHTCFYYSFLLVCKAHFRQQLFWDPTPHPQAVGPPEPPQHPSPRSSLQGPSAGVAYLRACPALGVSAARGQARLPPSGVTLQLCAGGTEGNPPLG